jgi:hypothetical protein
MADFWIEARVKLDNLAEQMADEVERDELVKFVKELDDRVREWNFTHELRDYFNGVGDPEEV